MNRKIISGLSYGFYFIIVALALFLVYLFAFKDDKVKKNNSESQGNETVPETIKLNNDNISLDIGETYALKSTVYPSKGNETVTYEVEDETIAEVTTEGLITAKMTGKTKVIVKSGEAEASANITVSTDEIKILELFSTDTQIKIKEGETYQVNVVIVPSDAFDKTLIYTSTAEEYFTVSDSGLITGIKKGSGEITITSKKNPTASISIVVRII
jgi:uncharacterized protein YjdB